MNIPHLRGTIRRRILVNFRVDPGVAQRLLPEPFSPKLVNGAAVAGVCLLRLEHLRPAFLPAAWGLASENAAHRIAVCWERDGERHEGVYIPRRDSGSLVNILAGGRVFPGEHGRATFAVRDEPSGIELTMRSLDGVVSVDLRGKPALRLPPTSKFASLEEASTFFERGCLGYSETRKGESFEGLCLFTRDWRVEPLDVDEVRSSFFSDRSRFPPGSVEFDCALLMRDIDHEWRATPPLRRAALAQRGLRSARPAGVQ